MTITLDSIVSINPDILTSDVEEELLMMDMDSGYYYGLQGVGKQIWELIEAPIKVRDVCADLLTRYDIDAETVEREVLAFLRDMQEQALITLQDV